MTNPIVRSGIRSPAVQPGDRVKLHADGVNTFEILELDDTTARVAPVDTDAPGAYPFRIPRAGLVAV